MTNQPMCPVVKLGVLAHIRNCSATISEVVAAVELPEANDTLLGFAVIRTPAKRVSRVGRVGDKPPPNQYGHDVFDQPGLRAVAVLLGNVALSNAHAAAAVGVLRADDD